jgi:DNA-binding transcriptional LysR family regulator
MLDVAMGNTAQVARAVAEGEAELGLVEGAVDNPALSCITIGAEALSLVVAPDHPWAGGPAAADLDLRASRWVLREPGSGTRAAFEQVLAARGLALSDLTVAMVLPGNEAVRSAVEAGAGAGVMSRTVARLGVARGALVEVDLPLPPRQFLLLRHKQRYRSKAAEAFLALASAPADDQSI